MCSVRQLLHMASFFQEPADRERLPGQLRLQHLEGHFLAAGRIAGQKHDAHAALACHGQNLEPLQVAQQAGPRRRIERPPAHELLRRVGGQHVRKVVGIRLWNRLRIAHGDDGSWRPIACRPS